MHRYRCHLAAWLFVTALATTTGTIGSVYAAATVKEPTVLTAAAAEAVLDAIFARQVNVTFAQADIVTTTVGGIMSRQRKTYANLWYEKPYNLRILERGRSEKPLPADRCTLRLLDGKYYWELYPQYEGEAREGSRRTFKAAEEDGKGVDIASYFVGMAVKSARDLYSRFAVTVRKEWRADMTYLYHVTLKDKKKDDAYQMWFKPGAALPQKVEQVWTTYNVTTKKKKTNMRTRELRNVKTSLDGLKSFPVETFLFPLKGGTKISAMPKDIVIPHARLKIEIELRRKQIIAARQQRQNREKEKTAPVEK